MKAAILIATLILVGCGGGSSGGRPAPVCIQESTGIEVDCNELNVLCVLFGCTTTSDPCITQECLNK